MRSVTTGDPSGIAARILLALDSQPATSVGASRLCAACVLVLGVERVAIAVHVGDTGWWEVLGSSDGVASEIEGVQATIGEGPGISAAKCGGPVFLSDLRDADGRWPFFAAALSTLHAGAVLAVPLQMGAIHVGVLDLYFASTGPLANEDLAAALTAAHLLTTLMLTEQLPAAGDLAADSWWSSPQSSREIHQATGMLVAQLDVGIREAYARLQGYAFSHGQLLSDTAREVVDRHLRFDPST